ncbi:hypothetical protein Pint_21902 [Pistacia integerrima]|uniref:Uncharacterized protein n=1 Tax=Pistacia integerrima TaxID=434235 RepID=A0ACC0XEY2_9ROSI|nr:hypothetical protein Pint_21902 [Pistacia integerrima]
MSSILGVSSTLFLEVSAKRATTSSLFRSLPLADKSHFNALIASNNKPLVLKSSGVSFVPSAIATPNNVLGEEAFKGLGDFSDNSDSLDEDYESENVSTDDDELAISKLGLPDRLVGTLEKRGITQLFPIQRAVLVPALQCKDLIARAKTGTGKTLAFGIPILKRLTEEADKAPSFRRGRLPKVLVLAPTRELAKQVEKELRESAPYLNTVCVYGGVPYYPQQNALARGVDVVVGTPGRIIDLIESNALKLGKIEFLVIDEADQMLAVGFEEDVEVILENIPPKRQSMLFSATMPAWVKKLSRKYLDNPLNIDLVGDGDEKLAEGIKLYAISTTATSKRTILSDLVTGSAKGGKTIVFTRTKRDADEISRVLTKSIASEALHGDKSQHQRERTLNGFRQGKFTVLVATDVAARGLDIPNVDLVIHYELPNGPETFVHRSGRTGRAGKEGNVILMFTNSQRKTVRSLEHDVGCKFEFLSAPAIGRVLESSAEQVVATPNGVVHPESIEFYIPTAQKSTGEQGTDAIAAALALLSENSSRSLISHEQLPPLQDDDYDIFSNRDRFSLGGSRDERSFRASHGGWSSDDEDGYKGVGRSSSTQNRFSKSSGDDWFEDIPIDFELYTGYQE